MKIPRAENLPLFIKGSPIHDVEVGRFVIGVTENLVSSDNSINQVHINLFNSRLIGSTRQEGYSVFSQISQLKCVHNCF